MMDKRMFLPVGMTRIDQIVAPAEECFMMFVFMSLRATSIVQIATKTMWCRRVQQRPYLMMCFEFLSTQSPKKGLRARKDKNNHLKFVDNFLLSKQLLTVSQYQVWRKKTVEEMQKEPAAKKNLEKDEKMRRRRVMNNYYGKLSQYKSAFEMAKKEWKLSTDGVVRALRYIMKEKGFAAKIEYQKKKSTILVCETMSVTDDWVIDTYGKDIARKLMDRAEH
jgi:hypothetical protein